MKRNFILVCVSALVLALGLSASAGAGVSADTSAKPAAKKGKSCKGKAGKNKAGKSAVAAAQAKKKGKGCAKGKAKGTALSNGTYEDAAQSLTLTVSNGTVALAYVPPGFCAAINYTSDSIPVTRSGDTWKAGEDRSFSLLGEPATVKWDLAVKSPGLEYALNFKLEADTMIGLCKGEGHPKGTLTKLG